MYGFHVYAKRGIQRLRKTRAAFDRDINVMVPKLRFLFWTLFGWHGLCYTF